MKRKMAVGWVLLVGFLTAYFSIGRRLQNRLEIVNNSGQAISELTIVVGGESICFINVPPGAVVSSKFAIRSDDHFVVRGKFANDTVIAADCGYVTHGMWGERARFSIEREGKVEFSQSQYEA